MTMLVELLWNSVAFENNAGFVHFGIDLLICII